MHDRSCYIVIVLSSAPRRLWNGFAPRPVPHCASTTYLPQSEFAVFHRLSLAAFGVATAALLFSGCAADAVSDTITLNLKIKGDSAKSGVVSQEKEISSESGNPYGKFITAAKDAIGADPGRIELDTCELSLGAKSKGVTKLEEVFGGEVSVLLLVDSTKNSHNAAKAESVSGAGPAALTSSFKTTGLSAKDMEKIVKGDFKVVVRGNAASTFDGNKDQEADLQVSMMFAAYDE